MDLPTTDTPTFYTKTNGRVRQLANAVREDARNVVQAGSSTTYGETPTTLSAVDKVVQKWFAEIRALFKGFVIRRDSTSKDAQGNYLICLPPLVQIDATMDLYEDEYEHLDDIVQTMSQTITMKSFYGGSKVSKFSFVVVHLIGVYDVPAAQWSSCHHNPFHCRPL